MSRKRAWRWIWTSRTPKGARIPRMIRWSALFPWGAMCCVLIRWTGQRPRWSSKRPWQRERPWCFSTDSLWRRTWTGGISCIMWRLWQRNRQCCREALWWSNIRKARRAWTWTETEWLTMCFWRGKAAIRTHSSGRNGRFRPWRTAVFP